MRAICSPISLAEAAMAPWICFAHAADELDRRFRGKNFSTSFKMETALRLNPGDAEILKATWTRHDCPRLAGARRHTEFHRALARSGIWGGGHA